MAHFVKSTELEKIRFCKIPNQFPKVFEASWTLEIYASCIKNNETVFELLKNSYSASWITIWNAIQLAE